MVAMALMTMVLIAVLTVFDNFISTARVAEKRNESQEVARRRSTG
jgi:type II secretory pathway component PulJ